MSFFLHNLHYCKLIVPSSNLSRFFLGILDRIRCERTITYCYTWENSGVETDSQLIVLFYNYIGILCHFLFTAQRLTSNDSIFNLHLWLSCHRNKRASLLVILFNLNMQPYKEIAIQLWSKQIFWSNFLYNMSCFDCTKKQIHVQGKIINTCMLW